MQSSTAELITGLVQLVPLTNTTQLSQEAMEVSSNTHLLLLPQLYTKLSESTAAVIPPSFRSI